jgi:hypothetical protein
MKNVVSVEIEKSILGEAEVTTNLFSLLQKCSTEFEKSLVREAYNCGVAVSSRVAAKCACRSNKGSSFDG